MCCVYVYSLNLYMICLLTSFEALLYSRLEVSSSNIIAPLCCEIMYRNILFIKQYVYIMYWITLKINNIDYSSIPGMIT